MNKLSIAAAAGSLVFAAAKVFERSCARLPSDRQAADLWGRLEIHG